MCMSKKMVLAVLIISVTSGTETKFQIGIIKLGAPNALGLHNAEFWMSGSLAGAKWSYLGLPLLVLAFCMAFLMLNYRGLNLLLLGDDAAAFLTDARR